MNRTGEKKIFITGNKLLDENNQLLTRRFDVVEELRLKENGDRISPMLNMLLNLNYKNIDQTEIKVIHTDEFGNHQKTKLMRMVKW